MNDELREDLDEMIEYVAGRISGSTEPAEPDMTCPACGEAEVHVAGIQWQYWVCENCEMSSRVGNDDALADLVWWQDAARVKRLREDE